jgi:hypothetical protein
MKRWMAAAVTAALGSGCLLPTQLQTARTVPPGTYELSAGASAVSMPGPGEAGHYPIPSMELGIRAGLSDRWDVGVRFPLSTTSGSRLDAKVQVIRSEHWDAAVAMGIVEPLTGLPLYLAFLGDWSPHPAFRLYGAVDLLGVASPRPDTNLAQGGITLGGDLRLGESGFSLRAEIGSHQLAPFGALRPAPHLALGVAWSPEKPKP